MLANNSQKLINALHLSGVLRVEATRAFAKKRLDPEYIKQLQEYNRARASWKRQLTELRKHWLEQQKVVVAANQPGFNGIVADRQPRQAVGDDSREKEKAMQRMLREAELSVEVAENNLKKATRAVLREQITQKYLDQRRQEVLQQSSSWITRDNLMDRINSTLDQPSMLHPITPYENRQSHG